jgi:hypothetical protein
MSSQTHLCTAVVEEQAMFSAAREHAVRLLGAFGYKIIDQNPDVSFVAFEDEGLPSPRLGRRVDPRDQPLCSRLFVSGGSVDLPS